MHSEKAQPEQYKASKAIIDQLSPLEGEESSRREYILGMLALVREDVLHVRLVITAVATALAVSAVQAPAGTLYAMPKWAKAVFLAGVLVSAAGAALSMRYIRHLHLTQMAITRCLPSLDVVRARELWAGVAGVAQYRWKQRLGRRLLIGGALVASVALVYAYLFQQPYDSKSEQPGSSDSRTSAVMISPHTTAAGIPSR